MKCINIKGLRFGRLIVLEKSNLKHEKHGVSWVCKCDCGNITTVKGYLLRKGKTTSCGCYAKECYSNNGKKTSYFLKEKIKESMIGKVFGYLTVLKFSHTKNNNNYWECLCKCGNTTIVNTRSLNNGHTSSCGCFRLESLPKKESHWNWKDGITTENARIRSSREYKNWRTQVFIRDNYACQMCGKKNCYLEAHHIKSFSEFPKDRLNISNGITLCKECHSLKDENRKRFTKTERSSTAALGELLR